MTTQKLFGALAAVALLVSGPPVSFIPLAAVWMGLDLGLLWALWRPGTSAYLVA